MPGRIIINCFVVGNVIFSVMQIQAMEETLIVNHESADSQKWVFSKELDSLLTLPEETLVGEFFARSKDFIKKAGKEKVKRHCIHPEGYSTLAASPQARLFLSVLKDEIVFMAPELLGISIGAYGY